MKVKIIHPYSMKALTTIVLLFLVFAAAPAMNQFAASGIPDDLLTDANSVYRINNMEVVIDGPGSYTVKREIAITILNENGKGPDVLVINYNSDARPRFNEGAIYDGNGERITRIRRRDLDDMSNFSDFSLYEDNRVLAYQPRISGYPYTVRYSYEVSYSRGMYYFRTFMPSGGFNRSAESASLTIDYPAGQNVKYFINMIEEAPEQYEVRPGRKRLRWSFDHIPAVHREFLATGFGSVAPGVRFATDRFEFDGYMGVGTSWQEFGNWIWQMNLNRDRLPQERIDFLRDLVKDMDSDREKVKAVYEFLQSRTRYVNIAFGIGGLQPIDAATVDRTGYGDCKDLTNYMMAMLKAIGIESHYTLVYAGVGSYRINRSMPVNQFNHIILCVPMEKDTIWLECTSQSLPFGHLGDFTDGRPVLVIREDGGHLAQTYGYTPEDNIITTRADIVIDERGNGSGKIKLERGGLFYVDYYRSERLSEQDQQRWIYNNFSFPNYSLEQHGLSSDLEGNPVFTIDLDVNLRTLANISGQRLFVPVNALSHGVSVPPRVRNRKLPFELKFPVNYSDTLVFSLPSDYVPETLPTLFHLESEFGVYTSSVELVDDKVVYVRKLQTFTGIFEPELYQDYFRFYQNISRADNQNLVFLRK